MLIVVSNIEGDPVQRSVVRVGLEALTEHVVFSHKMTWKIENQSLIYSLDSSAEGAGTSRDQAMT